MNDKKHIDRLFQEKFKNFEASPDDVVWENIHNTLHKNKRKRRVIPLWWFAGGAAAILVLLFTVGKVFNSSEDFTNPEINVVATEKTRSASESTRVTAIDEKNNHLDEQENNTSKDISTAESSQSTVGHSEKVIQKEKAVNNGATTNRLAQDNSGKNTTDPSLAQDEVDATQNNRLPVNKVREETVATNRPQLHPDEKTTEPVKAENASLLNDEKDHRQIAKLAEKDKTNLSEILKEDKDIIALNTKDESIEEAIAKANSTNEKEKEEQPNRWNITPNVAPVYFNTLGKGSTISSQFVNNTKSGEVNMSYGINGSYAINDKIKIRAGVNKVGLGYSTDGVIALGEVNSLSGGSGSKEMQNINFSNRRKADAYMSTSNINGASAPQFMVSNVNGALEQQFGYIEVPLEVEYSIIDSKFGLNVIGGFSTLFLNDNEVYTVLNNERSLLGEANNINSTSYSANFGLGFNYNLSRTIKLNLEPMFKYQLNTFTNTSGDFRPYFIGVYTGFSFKF